MSLSIDTGVIAEYIDIGAKYHLQAKAVLDSIISGRADAVIAHPVLAESYYVSSRIYSKSGLDNPEDRSRKLLEWLYSSPNFSIAEPTMELALLSGKVKSEFGVALTDAYVLAASKLAGGKAVFRIREKEMAGKLTDLTKEYSVVFLEGNE